MTYTRHGHHIPGTVFDDEKGQIQKVRCGGIALCTDCQKDLAQAHRFEIPNLQDREVFEDLDDVDRPQKKAKLFVVGAYNNRVGEEDAEISVSDLKIVWFAYILGGWKALLITSEVTDGLYFEVTHNAERSETYVDTYIKIANDAFTPEGQ